MIIIIETFIYIIYIKKNTFYTTSFDYFSEKFVIIFVRKFTMTIRAISGGIRQDDIINKSEHRVKLIT